MLLVALLLGAPACAGPVHQDPAASGVIVQSVRRSSDVRVQPNWYTGSFDDLLREAASSQRIVLLNFRSDWITYSKMLDKVTLSSPDVLAELEDLLCFAIDGDSKEGKNLGKKFQVRTPPALVFLDPDGRLRDQLCGFYGPAPFVKELRRIRRNEGTFSDLRARVQKSPDDLDSRWQLACKLKTIGDLRGFEEQVSQIRERDPEAKSVAARRMRLCDLATAAGVEFDLEPLYAFVRAESDRTLLFEGWLEIWKLEGEAARSIRDPEKARSHGQRYFESARALWPLVPEEEYGRLGNNIAWNVYENRASASHADLEFALQVATKAVAAAPDVAAVVDTYACCLHALGRVDEALVQVKRCIELDPQNPSWRERLTEFTKGR
jgi:tetratricopeptide (TPR) repeat protein